MTVNGEGFGFGEEVGWVDEGADVWGWEMGRQTSVATRSRPGANPSEDP
jgi:hypothetical protein